LVFAAADASAETVVDTQASDRYRLMN